MSRQVRDERADGLTHYQSRQNNMKLRSVRVDIDGPHDPQGGVAPVAPDQVMQSYNESALEELHGGNYRPVSDDSSRVEPIAIDCPGYCLLGKSILKVFLACMTKGFSIAKGTSRESCHRILQLY